MDYVKVGKIVSTFGIKGEIKLNPLTDDLERFKNPGPYYLDEEKLELSISKFRINKNQVIIKFEDYDNINDVLEFKDAYLYVRKDDRIDLEDGSYYIDDLIGIDIISQGAKYGTLVEVIPTLANDVYIIEKKDQGKIAVPAVKEFILDVNLDENYMEISLIDGMDYEI